MSAFELTSAQRQLVASAHRILADPDAHVRAAPDVCYRLRKEQEVCRTDEFRLRASATARDWSRTGDTAAAAAGRAELFADLRSRVERATGPDTR